MAVHDPMLKEFLFLRSLLHKSLNVSHPELLHEIQELQKKLKDNVTLDDVKRVVRTNGSQLQQKMQDKADFKKGYQTGATKESIRLEIVDAGFTAEVGPTTEYAEYLEYGTQPFIWPAFNEQVEKFRSDMLRKVK